MYGEQKEGADFAHDAYNVLYATLAETGDVLYQGLREGCTYTSAGTTEVLPGTIERVSRYFRSVRMRADSGFYDQKIVKICAEREVEFFIVAEQRRNLLKAVHAIPESDWKSFEGKHMQRGGGSGKQRSGAITASARSRWRAGPKRGSKANRRSPRSSFDHRHGSSRIGT